MSHDQEKQGHYFLESESRAEMTRLLEQEAFLNRALGELLPEQPEYLQQCHAVLDMACGPGGWILEVARAHPQVAAYGVDISQLMIEYANAQAQELQLPNAQYVRMDISQPLSFPDASFDLINVRYLMGFLAASRWEDLFLECKRLLRPGGIFRITDLEVGITSNSAALERLTLWLIHALWSAGQSFAPWSTGKLGLIAAVPALFRKTGYSYEGVHTHLIEFSHGTLYYEGFSNDAKALFQFAKPFILGSEIATAQDFERTFSEMVADLDRPDFLAVRDFHTFWGKKPS